jgi:hypothetical protein
MRIRSSERNGRLPIFGRMALQRNPQRKKATPSDVWPVYSTSAQHPGKLILRRPDGKEVVGTFQDGTFVPDEIRGQTPI